MPNPGAVPTAGGGFDVAAANAAYLQRNGMLSPEAFDPTRFHTGNMHLHPHMNPLPAPGPGGMHPGAANLNPTLNLMAHTTGLGLNGHPTGSQMLIPTMNPAAGLYGNLTANPHYGAAPNPQLAMGMMPMPHMPYGGPGPVAQGPQTTQPGGAVPPGFDLQAAPPANAQASMATNVHDHAEAMAPSRDIEREHELQTKREKQEVHACDGDGDGGRDVDLA